MRSFRPSAFSLLVGGSPVTFKDKTEGGSPGEASTPSKHCPSSQRPADSLFPDADEVRIEAALLHKLLMPPALDDPPPLSSKDLIRLAHGGDGAIMMTVLSRVRASKAS